MTITYPLSTPSSDGIVSWAVDMIDAVGVGESPYSFSQETFEHAGKRFEIEVQVARLTRADAAEWIAWLASLNGRKGTFLMGDTVGTTPRGIGTGTPLVKGSAQTGQVLLTDGWTTTQTGIMKKGDWIQLGTGSTSRLHMVLTDTNSDGSGNATLDLWPGPRTAPADNEAIVVNSANGLWRLSENRRGWRLDDVIRYGLAFSAGTP